MTTGTIIYNQNASWRGIQKDCKSWNDFRRELLQDVFHGVFWGLIVAIFLIGIIFFKL